MNYFTCFCLILILSPFQSSLTFIHFWYQTPFVKHLPLVSLLCELNTSKGLGCFHSQAQSFAMDKLIIVLTVNTTAFLPYRFVNKGQLLDWETFYFNCLICYFDSTLSVLVRDKCFIPSWSDLVLAFIYLFYWQYKYVLVLFRREQFFISRHVASFIICKEIILKNYKFFLLLKIREATDLCFRENVCVWHESQAGFYPQCPMDFPFPHRPSSYSSLFLELLKFVPKKLSVDNSFPLGCPS